jgi:hypothetical protein
MQNYPKMLYRQGWSDPNDNCMVWSNNDEIEANKLGFKPMEALDGLQKTQETTKEVNEQSGETKTEATEEKSLEERYFEKFGEEPDGRWSELTLKAKLNDN